MLTPALTSKANAIIQSKEGSLRPDIPFIIVEFIQCRQTIQKIIIGLLINEIARVQTSFKSSERTLTCAQFMLACMHAYNHSGSVIRV